MICWVVESDIFFKVNIWRWYLWNSEDEVELIHEAHWNFSFVAGRSSLFILVIRIGIEAFCQKISDEKYDRTIFNVGEQWMAKWTILHFVFNEETRKGYFLQTDLKSMESEYLWFYWKYAFWLSAFKRLPVRFVTKFRMRVWGRCCS
jgi:hypothetical protein